MPFPTLPPLFWLLCVLVWRICSWQISFSLWLLHCLDSLGWPWFYWFTFSSRHSKSCVDFVSLLVCFLIVAPPPPPVGLCQPCHVWLRYHELDSIACVKFVNCVTHTSRIPTVEFNYVTSILLEGLPVHTGRPYASKRNVYHHCWYPLHTSCDRWHLSRDAQWPPIRSSITTETTHLSIHVILYPRSFSGFHSLSTSRTGYTHRVW